MLETTHPHMTSHAEASGSAARFVLIKVANDRPIAVRHLSSRLFELTPVGIVRINRCPRPSQS